VREVGGKLARPLGAGQELQNVFAAASARAPVLLCRPPLRLDDDLNAKDK
jgi:hypothetical protein